MNKNKDFLLAFPNVELHCQSQYSKHGPDSFFTLFGKDWHNCGGYKPLFLASNYSTTGETATSYGLFKKNNSLYEIHGTECSMWNFEGQWKPEKVTWDVILHKINHGQLGQGYGDEEFAISLKAFVIKNMEKDNIIHYSKATDDIIFNCYTRKFDSHDLLVNNIILEELMQDFTYTYQYNKHLKPHYSQIFKEIFIDNIYIENKENNFSLYQFKKDNTLLFIKITDYNYDFLLAHENINKPDFSLFELSNSINQIGENIVLSLLEKTNLFKKDITKTKEIKKLSM